MKRTPVKSSNLASVGYDSASKKLEVEFTTGAVYEYSEVPSSVALSLMKSKSKGNYFASHIKNKFTAKINETA